MKYIVCAVLIAVVLFGAIFGFGYLSFSNDANGFEVNIKAKWDNNRNVYDNGWKKVKEMAQVPSMQVAGLKDVYDGAMKGRYGADGSKAVLQFITEQNPNLDQRTYLKIQEAVEAFRNEFQSNQTELISQKQAYEKFLVATTNGRFYNMFEHYPHIDLSKYDIVTSDKTEQDFSTKKADELKLK